MLCSVSFCIYFRSRVCSFTPSLFVTGALKRRVQIVEIIHGSAVTTQALHSDVILHVPDGVYGIILGNIHTDHWRFREFVEEDDCIISPICQFDFKHIKSSEFPDEIRFRIQVGHIAREASLVEHIRVKEGHEYQFSDVKTFGGSLITDFDNEVYFKCNSKYVDIYTHHFSEYIIFAEDRNCCGQSIAMVGFSKMDEDELGQVATAILYFCSLHYIIFEDYAEVNIL